MQQGIVQHSVRRMLTLICSLYYFFSKKKCIHCVRMSKVDVSSGYIGDESVPIYTNSVFEDENGIAKTIGEHTKRESILKSPFK